MEGRHCTTNELIDALYGIGIGGEHVQGCPACAARLAGMRERRRESCSDVAFSDADLADQSRRWRERVAAARPRLSRWQWSWRVAAASAALALVTVAILPKRPPAPADDARLFEDALRKAAIVEPESFAPMENLFERSKP
jgi:anti-sigma factor RsiW